MSNSDDMIQNQKLNLPLLATRETCKGRTYIVTGANVGLGYEAAKHLAGLGSAKVILGVRNPTAGEKARAEIEVATTTTEAEDGIGGGVVEVWTLDLSSYDSVKAFADRAATELDRIDGVIENAAVALMTRDKREGHATSLTVNLLGTLLLGVLLLPKLRECAAELGTTPRLSFVTSRAGFTMQGAWEQILDDPLAKFDAEFSDSLTSYRLTKLLETITVRYFAEKVAPFSQTGVIVNLICPGFCATELGRNAPPEYKAKIESMHQQWGRTAEDGSRTLLHGAVASNDTHGKLLHSCGADEAVVPDWVPSTDDKSSQRLWEVVAKELEMAAPGCLDKILG